MRAGVLALQGDWEAHTQALRELGVHAQPVRTGNELEQVDALVLPGGESTAMLRLMGPEGLGERLTARVRSGMPVLATCAGLILLACSVEPEQPSLGLLDVDVVRNAYGRQVHSTVAFIELEPDLGQPREMEAVFIRAPQITRIGPKVRSVGRYSGDPAVVRQDRIVAATFHPELTSDRRIHRLFCRLGEHSDV
jgi:5'-phosphate synthase pdxT subunit